MFTILVKNRDLVLKEIQKKEIGVAVHYNPVHLLNYYKNTFGYVEGDFPIAEEIGSQTITLPIYPKLTDEEINYVIENVNLIVNKEEPHGAK
jgi:dTDP-4-amino-4,6-dideoxygalactose transaminase